MNSPRKIWRVVTPVSLVLFLILPASSDEWKASHGLVSVTGVMNLTEPPPPSEVFFSGPDNPSQAAGWLDGLNGWRADRRGGPRDKRAPDEPPPLEWTQQCFFSGQV